jgi:hypothetical protein
MFAVPLLGAGLATALFWLLREQFDLVARANGSGWYGASESVQLIPLIFGSVLAITIALAIFVVDRSSIVLAGGLAVVGSFAAALLVDFVVMPQAGYFWQFFFQIALFAIALALVFAALAGESAFSWPREVAVSVAGAVVVLALAVACVHAAKAVPSAEADRMHYLFLMKSELQDERGGEGPLLQMKHACLAPIDSSTPKMISSAIDSYSNPYSYPATPELRQLHASLLDTLEICQTGGTEAIATGRNGLTHDQATRFDTGMKRYLDSFISKVVGSG